MGLRFRRSIKIAPGIKFNVTKRGVGLTAGVRGAHVSINSSGRKTKSIGIPGTGLSYVSTSQKSKKQKSVSSKKSNNANSEAASQSIKEPVYYSEKTYNRSKTVFIILAIISFIIGIPTIAFGGIVFVIIGIVCILFARKCKKTAESQKNEFNN
jgi:Ca2+-dependent lipid-binding protein